MLEHILKNFDVNTDAISTNKGFYYQYLTILKKWLANFIAKNDVTTFTEVDQDIKEVGEHILFTQVKCYTSNFSLNSEAIKNTIFDFFLLYLKNKDLVENPKFCFATNTAIAAREKLLVKWINDEHLQDAHLLLSCKSKINEILIKEIKSKKNKKLNHNISDEKRQSIKTAVNDFIKIVDQECENFTKSVRWQFENLSPDEAITEIKNDIDILLQDKAFGNKPTTLLFGVLMSEIYKRSQSKIEKERSLTKQVIIDLLAHSDTELEKYLNIKFFKLLNIEFEILKGSIQKIQAEIDNHEQKINLLEKKSNSISAYTIPKEINLLPDYKFSSVYDWDAFLNTVNLELQKKNVLSIYSEGGMGKTSFAKKYLKAFPSYDHLIWITVDKTISYSLVIDDLLIKNLNIEFSPNDEIDHRFKIILNRLNTIEGTNLIIIDIQELEKDLTSLKQLTSLSNWQKLILTRNNIRTVPSIKLPKINIESAKSIFNSHYTKEPVDNVILSQFIEFIDFNILVIELVAKTIEYSFDLTLEKLLESLKEQNLDDDEFKVDIDVMENNSTINIFNYLLKKFSLTDLESWDSSYLQFLSLLPSRDIIIEDVILLNGAAYYEENKTHITNTLISLERKGLVEFTRDRKRINIHKIIKEVILYNGRETLNPFVDNVIFITWLTARIKEGQNNPSIAFRYLKYAQSILDNIKEQYRRSVYQPLIILESELLYLSRYYVNSENDLDRLIDLAARAEKYPMLDGLNLGVIYNNLGLAYAYTDYEKAVEQFEKAVALFEQNEIKFRHEIITTRNNISNLYLKSKDVVKALENFKKIQNFRMKHNIYNDQQVVVEYRIIAESYKICGDLKTAIKSMSDGIKYHNTLDAEKRNDFLVAACYNYLSQLYLSDGNLDLAILHQENAIKIIEDMKLKNSEYLLLMYQILKPLYHHKGLAEKENEITTKISLFIPVEHLGKKS
ncbi:hypothetical protein EYY60_16470 [Flavobacterium zhairuonense]|uniref:tetratricopeptide repeat protein n=1 Tax=Flavobacterium zhairuonense TaxID=2493631 RepID=UPI00104955DA|nr:tetratricopeptide repeat protein [Flavobacterium zhairuonense]KAF2508715.1 hypothetical protein EYY60_16470 [Flavobacterium zhairuonense]